MNAGPCLTAGAAVAVLAHTQRLATLGEDDVPDHRICVPELTDVKNPEARA